MKVFLIDDQGEIWPASTRQLREAFDSPYSGGEFLDYAVANLGFVAVHVHGTSCHVRIRPALLGDLSAASVHRWLEQSRSLRVVVTWLGDDWSSELIGSIAAARRRIDELVDAWRHARPGDFLSSTVPAARLDATSLLGRIGREWPQLCGPAARDELMGLLRSILGERYVLVRRDPGSGRVIFQEFGRSIFAHYETWRTCAVGAPMEEQPDRSYGQWTARAYQDAFAISEPVVADVDAIVRWPHAGRVRMRYKRVLVPLLSATDPHCLLGGSLLDNRIDLRVGAV